MIDYRFLQTLCETNGISGDESSVRTMILDIIKPYADEVRVVALGNILVHL